MKRLTTRKILVYLGLSLQLLQMGCKERNKPTVTERDSANEQAASGIADNTIWHFGHSANLLKIGGRVFVFDYPYGSEANSEWVHYIDPNQLKNEKVYVFVSHGHGDHYNTAILTWKNYIPHIKYILSSDFKRFPEGAVLISPGQVVEVDDIKVRAYPSTDAGVAFSVYADGKHIYFAGDNGFWNWEGKRPQEDYINKDLASVDRTAPMDIAFQVCDPKAKGVGDGGVGIFAVTFQPKLLVPIHLRGEYEFLTNIELQLKNSGFKNRFWVIRKISDTTSF